MTMAIKILGEPWNPLAACDNAKLIERKNTMTNLLQTRFKKINHLYLPEHVFIKPQSEDDPATAEIVRRIQALNPDIPIVHMRDQRIPFPKRSTSVGRWRQRKKNFVLAHRTTPFLTTFASPGNIVERMGVILNLCWQCPCDCSFCYLQTVMPPDHVIYTNVENLDREMPIEPYVHRSILSLWTIISFIRKEELKKIPQNFHEAANYIRRQFIKEGIRSKNEAVGLLTEILRQKNSPVFEILQKGKPDVGFTAKNLRVDRKTLSAYYDKNAKYRPRISAAEYTDLLAFDHLCGHSGVLMNQVARVPDVEVTLRTKSAYVDEMLGRDGHDRVTIAVNFNTPFVIENYEPGTASLDDRLLAAQKVQAAKGFKLGVVIEPVIKYPGFEKDYVALAGRIMKAIDPTRISDIAVGCVRYSGRLEARIMRNFPETDLFNVAQGLLPIEKNDRRRYSLIERVGIYKLIFDEFRKHTNAYLRLGAETPDVWQGLGLDATALMDKSIYQYNRDAFESNKNHNNNRRNK